MSHGNKDFTSSVSGSYEYKVCCLLHAASQRMPTGSRGGGSCQLTTPSSGVLVVRCYRMGAWRRMIHSTRSRPRSSPPVRESAHHLLWPGTRRKSNICIPSPGAH
jgi:hypothetical protein